jgi:hypothetical protein
MRLEGGSQDGGYTRFSCLLSQRYNKACGHIQLLLPDMSRRGKMFGLFLFGLVLFLIAW